jgi:hypothetical protein
VVQCSSQGTTLLRYTEKQYYTAELILSSTFLRSAINERPSIAIVTKLTTVADVTVSTELNHLSLVVIYIYIFQHQNKTSQLSRAQEKHINSAQFEDPILTFSKTFMAQTLLGISLVKRLFRMSMFVRYQIGSQPPGNLPVNLLSLA